MEAILREQLARINSLIDGMRERILGKNNERIDFIMDSFYKLSPEQRTAAIIGSVVGLCLLVIGVFTLYFAGNASLEARLNAAFNDLNELRQLKAQYLKAQATHQNLLELIRSRTADLRVKPFFEEKANAFELDLRGLEDKIVPLPESNPLAPDVKYVIVTLRFPKISIPRLLNFVVDVEKSGKLITVQELKINSILRTKLYFDVTIKFRGYQVGE